MGWFAWQHLFSTCMGDAGVPVPVALSMGHQGQKSRQRLPAMCPPHGQRLRATACASETRFANGPASGICFNWLRIFLESLVSGWIR